MNYVISRDLVMKIKEAQDKAMCNIRIEVNNEILYISGKFQEELQNNLEKLLLNPFNLYIKIPRISSNNDKLYIIELKKQYSKTFHHDLQITDKCFLIIVKHHDLMCDGDPRPRQLMIDSSIEPEASSLHTIFNEVEKKKFEDELESSQFKRPSIRSGFAGEKKDILVPLFLQRRNSKMSLPSISARRQMEVSVSDNPEASEL